MARASRWEDSDWWPIELHQRAAGESEQPISA